MKLVILLMLEWIWVLIEVVEKISVIIELVDVLVVVGVFVDCDIMFEVVFKCEVECIIGIGYGLVILYGKSDGCGEFVIVVGKLSNLVDF